MQLGAVRHARENYRVSEWHACQLLGRGEGRNATKGSVEDTLIGAIIALASEYGRYGYRRITVKIREAGSEVGTDRMERI